MNPSLFAHLRALAALGALPVSTPATPFEVLSPQLDLDGTFISVLDFDGDGQEIGKKLDRIYEQVLATQPDMPPIPIDFPTVLETLGFGSIDAMAFSSKEIGDGLVRNRSVVLLDGEPAGLTGLYDLEPRSFRAAALAPADATTVVSASIQFGVLRDTVRALASQFMGAVGEGMVDNVIQSAVPGTDVAVNEIIDGLSAPLDLVMKQGMKPNGQPDFQIWASVEGAGSLLGRLKALSESMPVTVTEDADGLRADCSEWVQNAEFGLYLEAPAGSDNLLIYTDMDWAAAIGGGSERLATQPAFARLMTHLPAQAATYAYSAGFDPSEVLAMLEKEPEVQPYLPLIRTVIENFVGDFLAPNASAGYRKGPFVIADQYAGYSLKEAVMFVPAALSVGVGAAIAIPAIEKQKAASVEARVTNNLRQIAVAAQQKMLDEGVTEVTVPELVGPGRYIVELPSIVGESYDDITITESTSEISVELPDGGLISYIF